MTRGNAVRVQPVAGLSEARSVGQEREGGPRGCALTHACRRRGAARNAGGNSSPTGGTGTAASGDGGMPANDDWKEQYGQCSAVCVVAGDPEASPSSATIHLEPCAVQTSIQDGAWSELKACETMGASAASSSARTAIQLVRRRLARVVITRRQSLATPSVTHWQEMQVGSSRPE